MARGKKGERKWGRVSNRSTRVKKIKAPLLLVCGENTQSRAFSKEQDILLSFSGAVTLSHPPGKQRGRVPLLGQWVANGSDGVWYPMLVRLSPSPANCLVTLVKLIYLSYNLLSCTVG